MNSAKKRSSCSCGEAHASMRTGLSSHIPLAPDRRTFLRQAGSGLGMLALAGLFQEQGLLASAGPRPGGGHDPLLPKAPHFAPKAKSIIFMFMQGGPSAFDTFDYKPELQKHHGQPLPNLDIKDVFFGSPGPLMASPFKFRQYGDSGTWVSELFPSLAERVDDLALIKSCVSRSANHSPATLHMNTGFTQVGRPSMGSWITYGLGSENRNMPGYVILFGGKSRRIVGGAQSWSNGFLPGSYQATPFRSEGEPILNLQRPKHLTGASQRRQLDFLAQLNQAHADQHPTEDDLTASIQNCELAYRMQMAAPEITDLAEESNATRALYGADDEETQNYGRALILARRLVEKGVRFVQVYGGGWDAHGNIDGHRRAARRVDRPIAGLLHDLKARGLLSETLLVWGGEFGRLPVSEGSSTGRDHNARGFLMWMAGAGIKGGSTYGNTDDFGYRAIENVVTVHDIHATILHQLGMDHERLTYRHQGRDFRLTDVEGNVLRHILV